MGTCNVSGVTERLVQLREDITAGKLALNEYNAKQIVMEVIADGSFDCGELGVVEAILQSVQPPQRGEKNVKSAKWPECGEKNVKSAKWPECGGLTRLQALAAIGRHYLDPSRKGASSIGAISIPAFRSSHDRFDLCQLRSDRQSCEGLPWGRKIFCRGDHFLQRVATKFSESEATPPCSTLRLMDEIDRIAQIITQQSPALLCCAYPTARAQQ